MMRQDFRLAIRCLCATPVITAVAILSLALGIGANTAVFSLVDSLLLRELRVVDPDRLTLLSTGAGDEHQQYSNLTVDQVPGTRRISTACAPGHSRGRGSWGSVLTHGWWTDNSSAATTSRRSASGPQSGD